jgi:NAD(P)-dependent dehydrogenase (short-subunit alcohol dehydrogenase family)
MTDRKIAVITGASKGIGRGIAYRLADEGFDVAVNYANDREGAEETAREIENKGRKTLVIQADVGFSDQVERLFDTVIEEWGIPDVLVNNAGVQSWSSLIDLSEAEWDRTLRTNLKGTFLCTQRAAREMAKREQGRIVNIGSGCNKLPFPKLVDYTASKGGIDLFTRVASVELGPLGVTVNCVAPGAIAIERTKLEAPDYAAVWSPITPMRKIGTPADVAAAVAYLVSDDGAFVSGQTLYVDGGLFIQGPWPYDL